MAGRYRRLAAHLAALPPETTTVTLTFAELGAILGRPLPASAWGRSWWATRAWPLVGWRLSAVSVSGGREAATFARIVEPSCYPPDLDP
jgi:hypothetical protein